MASSTSTHERSLVWLVLGLGLALALALSVTNAAPTARGPDREAAAFMLEMVNSARAEQDLAALERAEEVTVVAERWSAQMAAAETLEHNPNYAEQLCCWTVATENVAFSEPHRFWLPGDPVERITAELHEHLLASPGHRLNILDPEVDQIGIGVHVADDGAVWITQNFRRYRSG